MPLFTQVDRILHEGLDPWRALDELMRVPAGHDALSFPERPRLQGRTAVAG